MEFITEHDAFVLFVMIVLVIFMILMFYNEYERSKSRSDQRKRSKTA